MQSTKQDIPESLHSISQAAGSQWCLMISEKAFVRSALSSLFVTVLLAFLINLLATKNIIVSIMTVFSISLVIVSNMGLLNLFRWELGASESVSLIVVMGLSIDYITLLSIDYSQSPLESRNDKIRQAYGNMGVSILGGCTALLGATLFLFLATNYVFFKFALLVCFTVFMAFLVSMMFFGSVCHVIGPQDGVGDVPFYYIERQVAKLDLCRFFKKPCSKIRGFFARNFYWLKDARPPVREAAAEESQTQSHSQQHQAKRTDSSQGKISSNPNHSSESYVPQKNRKAEARKTKLNKIVEQP